MLGEKDVIRLVRAQVKRAGGKTAWARKIGVVPSIVNMVFHGKRPPNEKIIRALKLRRVVRYERIR
jgi:hypothetical protein